MPELGDIVLYLQELEKSRDFYREVAGLRRIGRIFNNRGAVLSSARTHHDLLLLQVNDAPGPLQGKRLDLYHVGWKVGNDLDDLRKAKQRVEAFGTAIDGLAEHTVSQSLYIRYPDGDEVELYIDNPDFDWKNNDSRLDAPVKALKL